MSKDKVQWHSTTPHNNTNNVVFVLSGPSLLVVACNGREVEVLVGLWGWW
jgi:hypothetical protein